MHELISLGCNSSSCVVITNCRWSLMSSRTWGLLGSGASSCHVCIVTAPSRTPYTRTLLSERQCKRPQSSSSSCGKTEQQVWDPMFQDGPTTGKKERFSAEVNSEPGSWFSSRDSDTGWCGELFSCLLLAYPSNRAGCNHIREQGQGGNFYAQDRKIWLSTLNTVSFIAYLTLE